MLSVQEAREKILAYFEPVTSESIPLHQAAGRVLSRDIAADTELPPFDNSSVDGFAVRATDVASANGTLPITLHVVTDIPAGVHPHTPVAAGQAARIMTGAAMPTGADAVVMVENTDFTDRPSGTPAPQNVSIYRSVNSGENVRPRGSDLTKGQVVLPAQQMLRAADLGLLAMLGINTVPVMRKPRLALLSSGDELLPVDAPLTPGKIRDANSTTLSTLAMQSGAEVIHLGVAADNADAVHTLLERAVESGADVIVSSAGVSVGAFDFIKDVVETNGSIDFWKVNMRPGKPLAVGTYRGIPFIGLPGNPVSAFVGFLVFVQPALNKFAGLPDQPRNLRRARLIEPIDSDGRESYLRAVVSNENGALVARLTGHQGSGNLLSLVQANALLIVPSGVKSLPPEAEVEAWLL